MIDVQGLVSTGFYSIEDKNLLLQAYQEVFNISLCATCQASYKQAYQELKTYIKNQEIMATNNNKKPQKPVKHSIKDEYLGATLIVSGLGSIKLNAITADQIKKYFLPNPSMHYLLNETKETTSESTPDPAS